MTAPRSGNILEVDDLWVEFPSEGGPVQAVRGLSLQIAAGSTVALLGESGCGKSVSGRAILGLVDAPGRVARGTIRYRRDTSAAWIPLSELDSAGEKFRRLRGREIAMIFQEPRSALTPVFTIGEQMIEAILAHESVPRAEARQRARRLLEQVGVPAAERRLDEYPHQLSGGMCQRAMIAMALSCQPSLLIADEPTTALDVTIQAEVLELLRQVREEFGTSILLITHDMGVVAEVADHVVVMYLGQVVESAPVMRLFDEPLHPYTRGLFASVPSPASDPFQPLPRIRGSVPDPRQAPQGCPFRPRCDHATEICRRVPPTISPDAAAPDHKVACWLHVPEEARK